MNILCGTVRADSGLFSADGRIVKPGNPESSSQAGIGMVHQHPRGAGSLRVLENIILGYEPRKFRIFTNIKKAERDIEIIQKDFNLPLNLNRRCSDLNSAQIQRMELLHLLYKEKKILIFDEPTASLSDHQINELMDILFQLKKKGNTILFISHKLNEVFRIADEIAIMRKGKVIMQKPAGQMTPESTAKEMIGESQEINYPIRSGGKEFLNKKILYSIEKLSYKKSDSEFLTDIDLHIHQGEILGIAGIRENGLEILEDIISGMSHPSKGRLIFNETDVSRDPPASLRARGISYVPADRLNRGVSADSTIAENLILLNYKRMHKMGILAPASINRWAENVQTADKIDGEPQQQMKHLSGGNIQKVILSRELRENPALIIICEPSWGLDFRSRNRLHEELSRTADKGTSVLLISSDIDEILALSDRIAVLYNGKINITENKSAMNRALIGEYMLGIRSSN
jgi:ABC-type uncharacterized transport system ATPase subunit